MARADIIEIEGKNAKFLPNTMFGVERHNNHRILAYIFGKMHPHFIRTLPGDKVLLNTATCDLTKGKITFCQK